MWSQVFVQQARSDWEVFEHLRQTAFPRCHMLHYLQMASEKLAKAYLLASLKDLRMKKSHKALTRFLRHVVRNRKLQTAMGMDAKQLRSHVMHFLPLAYDIEILAPSLAQDRPNPEYPWQDPNGQFVTPAKHHFRVIELLREPTGYSLIKFLRLSLTRFDLLN